jgi:hypothetical protein
MEEAAVESRPAGVSGGTVAVAVVMPVVRRGGVTVRVRLERMAGVVGRTRIVYMEGIAMRVCKIRMGGAVMRCCTGAVMLAGWTSRDPRPRHLQGQHGQQYQEDESFHGCGL